MTPPVRPTAKVDFNPFAPGLIAAPYDAYRELQNDDPVQWNPVIDAWIITRMTDVRTVMMDPAFEAISTAQIVETIAIRARRDYTSLLRFINAVLFYKDGEAHARDRRTLATVMNRVRLSELASLAGRMIRARMDTISRGESFDAIAVLADHYPQAIMALILGLPEEDVPTLSALLSDITLILDPATLSFYDRLKGKVDDTFALLGRRIKEAIARDDESGLSFIYQQAQGEGEEKLAQAAATVLFMHRVGSETTIGLIGTLMRTFVDDPAVAATLRANPDMIDRFVSENLRLDSSVQRAGRVATEPREIGGVNIAKGDRVLLLVGAANRDPRVFPSSDETMLDEKRPADLAFGAGKHFCLGASLARMEGRVFMQAMLEMPPMERAGTEQWYAGRTVRRLTSLPMRIAG